MTQKAYRSFKTQITNAFTNSELAMLVDIVGSMPVQQAGFDNVNLQESIKVLDQLIKVRCEEGNIFFCDLMDNWSPPYLAPESSTAVTAE